MLNKKLILKLETTPKGRFKVLYDVCDSIMKSGGRKCVNVRERERLIEETLINLHINLLETK